jgi:hypothetical protein
MGGAHPSNPSMFSYTQSARTLLKSPAPVYVTKLSTTSIFLLCVLFFKYQFQFEINSLPIKLCYMGGI